MNRAKTIWLGSTLGVLAVLVVVVLFLVVWLTNRPASIRYDLPSLTADVYCYDYNNELFHRTSVEQTDGNRNFDVPCPSPLDENENLISTIIQYSVSYCKGDESAGDVDRYLHFLGENYRSCEEETDAPPRYPPLSLVSNLESASANSNHLDFYCYTFSNELFYHVRTSVELDGYARSICPPPPDLGPPYVDSRVVRQGKICEGDIPRRLYTALSIIQRDCDEDVGAPPRHIPKLITYESQHTFGDILPRHLQMGG